MTLNEIIEWAREHGVNFDALVSVPHHDAMDVRELDVMDFSASGKTGLVIRII